MTVVGMIIVQYTNTDMLFKICTSVHTLEGDCLFTLKYCTSAELHGLFILIHQVSLTTVVTVITCILNKSVVLIYSKAGM